ncbi:MAG: NADH-quinone oxidoreductase subunit D [Cyanobacteria bacterium TGS_CYA1]|nr:NADH-quinone oxidoreductase subunit D [Cyanobacteria bacterium TGS_CYA1]
MSTHEIAITKEPGAALPKLKTDEMVINMGPQHPATHGVLRMVLTLDGEWVKHAEAVLGHLHRAQEWQGQNRTWFQYQALIDRVDYLSGMFTSWALCRTAEVLEEQAIPERAEWLRVMVSEMNRISSHLLWLGTYLIDLGAMFGFPFYPFREREKLLDLFEEIAGQRMMFNYIRIGGVQRDPKASWFQRLRKFTEEFNDRVDEYEAIVTENPIFLRRTKGVGILPLTLAKEFGVTGPSLRGSGSNFDLRKTKPYSVYPKLDFNVQWLDKPEGGDTWDRYILRIREMRESNKIIQQCLDMIPEGPVITKKQIAGLRVKAGEGFSAVESPRGILGCYVTSNGSDKPVRFRWRNPSFCNLSVCGKLLEGHPIADIMAIFGSIDVILPDVDR